MDQLEKNILNALKPKHEYAEIRAGLRRREESERREREEREHKEKMAGTLSQPLKEVINIFNKNLQAQTVSKSSTPIFPATTTSNSDSLTNIAQAFKEKEQNNPSRKRKRDAESSDADRGQISKRSAVLEALINVYPPRPVVPVSVLRRPHKNAAPHRMRTRSIKTEPIALGVKRGTIMIWRKNYTEYIVTSRQTYSEYYDLDSKFIREGVFEGRTDPYNAQHSYPLNASVDKLYDLDAQHDTHYGSWPWRSPHPTEKETIAGFDPYAEKRRFDAFMKKDQMEKKALAQVQEVLARNGNANLLEEVRMAMVEENIARRERWRDGMETVSGGGVSTADEGAWPKRRYRLKGRALVAHYEAKEKAKMQSVG